MRSSDTDFSHYFATAARDLIRRFGDAALPVAENALCRMEAKGDEDGYRMWLGVRDGLIEQMAPLATTTLH